MYDQLIQTMSSTTFNDNNDNTSKLASLGLAGSAIIRDLPMKKTFDRMLKLSGIVSFFFGILDYEHLYYDVFPSPYVQAVKAMLSHYLVRFSQIAGDMINCGPVLNWIEVREK